MSRFSQLTKGLLAFLILAIFVSGYYTFGYYFNHTETISNAFTVNTFVDDIIPFVAWFIIIYMSMYILAIMPYFYIHGKEEFLRVIQAYGFTLFLAFVIFFLFPVYMIRHNIVGTGFFENMVAFIYAVDVPFNAFPSLHVALSFLSAWFVTQYNKVHGAVMIVWAVLVGFSTMFIKQHYFLDVVAGLLISIIAYYLFEKIRVEWVVRNTKKGISNVILLFR